MITDNKIRKHNSRITHLFNFVRMNPYCKLDEIELGLCQLQLSRTTIKNYLNKMIYAPIPYLFKFDINKNPTFDIGSYHINPLGSPNLFDIILYSCKNIAYIDKYVNKMLEFVMMRDKRFIGLEERIGLSISLTSLGNNSYFYEKEEFSKILFEIGSNCLKDTEYLQIFSKKIQEKFKRIQEIPY